jgi:hypothetical protein
VNVSEEPGLAMAVASGHLHQASCVPHRLHIFFEFVKPANLGIQPGNLEYISNHPAFIPCCLYYAEYGMKREAVQSKYQCAHVFRDVCFPDLIQCHDPEG